MDIRLIAVAGFAVTHIVYGAICDFRALRAANELQHEYDEMLKLAVSQGELIQYLAGVLEVNDTPMTEFDKVVIDSLIAEMP